jgi:hypothetical protein
MPYATAADYETRFRVSLAGSELSQVEAWISDVSAVITSKLESTPDPDVARMVTVNAVHRIVNNPANVRSSQAGGMSVTYAVVGRTITDEEWDMLASSPAAAGAYTVHLVEETYGWSPDCPRWI